LKSTSGSKSLLPLLRAGGVAGCSCGEEFLQQPIPQHLPSLQPQQHLWMGGGWMPSARATRRIGTG
jgi:hypothetical protein